MEQNYTERWHQSQPNFGHVHFNIVLVSKVGSRIEMSLTGYINCCDAMRKINNNGNKITKNYKSGYYGADLKNNPTQRTLSLWEISFYGCSPVSIRLLLNMQITTYFLVESNLVKPETTMLHPLTKQVSVIFLS